MTKFLTLKHSQLFGLLIGLPMGLQIVIQGLTKSAGQPAMMAYFLPLLIIIYTWLFSGWLYTLATSLHKKLPPGASMNLKRFQFFLFIPMIYVLLLALFMIMLTPDVSPNGRPSPLAFALVIPLNIFVIFCSLYCLHFTAKALKTVEEMKLADSFSDFAQEFFLLWLYPFGLWLIQPRINRLFDPSAGKNN